MSTWVRKEKEVIDLKLDSTMMVTKLFARYTWKEINMVLSEYYCPN